MTTFAAPIEVYQTAFVLIGAQAPSSTSGTEPATLLANRIYEPLVRDALTRHAWSFAEKIAVLSYQAEVESYPPYKYDLPSDVLLPREVTYANVHYEKHVFRGGKLYAPVEDSDELRLIYTYRAAEAEWPADFADGVVHVLAGRLARGLLDRRNLGAELEAQGERKLRAARARDRATHPGPARNPAPVLVKAWRGQAVNTQLGENDWEAKPDASN